MSFQATRTTTTDRSTAERHAIERWEGEGGRALPYEEPRSIPRKPRAHSRAEQHASGAEART